MRYVALLLTIAVCASMISCSPGYVIRAGWEEAGILLRRKEITEVANSPQTDHQLARKLKLVLKARDFAHSVGLEPKKSFTYYSEINRDVLVWVLSASPKTKLENVTWWFPIVGRFPYKGFFAKEDALKQMQSFESKGYDVYLRPAAAFSTLGWFNDPVLSTTLAYNDISLVNTVIHEILHNTIWLKNHVSFNETLANVVGALGAIEFFRITHGQEHELSHLAEDRWHDEQIYGNFLAAAIRSLESFYDSIDQQAPELSLVQVLEKRESIFDKIKQDWEQLRPELVTNRFSRIDHTLNNAVLVSQRVYFDRPWVFVDLYKICNNSLEKFVDEMKLVQKNIQKEGIDPFEAVLNRTKELQSELRTNGQPSA